MVNYTITCEAGHLNVSPLIFHAHAKQYLACMKSFTTAAPNSPVPYFLLCRAIELVLKAKHLELSSRDSVKQEYGHNLMSSYNALSDEARILSDLELKTFKEANDIYSKKGFEYVALLDVLERLAKFPDLKILEQIATKLIVETVVSPP